MRNGGLRTAGMQLGGSRVTSAKVPVLRRSDRFEKIGSLQTNEATTSGFDKIKSLLIFKPFLANT